METGRGAKPVINYVSGHLDLTPDEFEAHYRRAIDVALVRGEAFVVGNARGTEAMTQSYLLGKTTAVVVYHIFTNPQNNAGFQTVGGFESDAGRDARMTADSDQDIAWVRPGRTQSGTQKNLDRRRQFRSRLVDATPVSLLERVCQQGGPEAWGRFVQLYSPLIFSWGRHCGLQPADAADLTQDVFTTLFEKLPSFIYDQHKSFRSWLRRVTLNHWRDRRRRIATRPLPGDDQQLPALEAGDELSVLAEDEYRQQLVQRALQIMQADFQPATWQAFWQHGILNRAAAEVAAELGLTPSAVYCARLRVLSRLRQELQGLLD